MDHDGVGGGGHVLLSPGALIDRADVQHLSPVEEKVLEDLIFLTGELHHPAIFHGATAVLIQVEAGVQNLLPLSLVHPVPTEQRIHLHEQLRLRKGLWQEVVSAACIGRGLVSQLGLGREEQNGRRGKASNGLTGRDPVHTGHHNVHQDQVIGRICPQAAHCLLAGSRLHHLVAPVLQQDPQQLPDVRLVVYY